MIPLAITADIEKAPWTELRNEPAVPGLGEVIKIGRLPHGMTSGKSAIMVMIRLPDGRLVAAQTSMALMLAAVQVLRQVDDDVTRASQS